MFIGAETWAFGKFYAENEFDLSNLSGIKRTFSRWGGYLCPLGLPATMRSSCFLWAGIIEYVRRHRVRYITVVLRSIR
jgi:putative hemolysin